VERKKIKDVSQRVEFDATPPSPVGSVSVGISSNVTLSEDHIAILDVEKIDLIAAKTTKEESTKMSCEKNMNLKLVTRSAQVEDRCSPWRSR